MIFFEQKLIKDGHKGLIIINQLRSSFPSLFSNGENGLSKNCYIFMKYCITIDVSVTSSYYLENRFVTITTC